VRPALIFSGAGARRDLASILCLFLHISRKEIEMGTRIVTTKSAPAPVGPYSQAVESGGFLFCSGQIPIDPASNETRLGSASEQADLVLKNVAAVLEAAGLSFQNVVKTTIFLTDMADFAAVNEVYATRFKSSPPARSTIAVAALPKGARVEIEVIAARA
jgi:2-iminobutanoate/2-iminopropanoate deaminase